ncbi:MAG TPA: pilus assembly protein PilM [Solirubrobacteraceae bacterium]|jgi:type IV pilus assembly protein PilM|nr:pilus assembly protein PilM [Solirubrobacteraceae bacterium]
MRLPSSPSLNLRRRGGSADVVGLDIQPGLVAAVKARVNGSILAERAAARPLDADVVREGEVVDAEALTAALRELFADSSLGKHVRLGVANQRTVMRTLDLPPVSDRKELAAAVRFQAQDQVPMPLNNAVLDFHPLGIFDTPAGSRQRVVLVAAQRDMVERLLGAVRAAGLTPEGVDLSAFALIRSLYDVSEGNEGRVLYLNVDGLTNLAIAEGTVCRFTRVIGGGVEAMASDLAARRGIPLAEARRLLATVDLSVPAPVPSNEMAVVAAEPEPEPAPELELRDDIASGAPDDDVAAAEASGERDAALSREEHEEREASMGYAETVEAAQVIAAAAVQPPQDEPADADIRAVLEGSVRDISGEIRNSLDFHRTQEQGGQVSHVALSGAALDLPGFADALQSSLGMEVRSEEVGLVDSSLQGKVSTHRLAVAAGLATAKAPQQ